MPIPFQRNDPVQKSPIEAKFKKQSISINVFWTIQMVLRNGDIFFIKKNCNT